MGNYDHVLSPIQIGPVRFKNRVSCSPMWPSFATGDGHANQELYEWVRDIVKGGAACVNIGCGCVNRDLPPFVTHLIRLAEEGTVNELMTLTDLAHMYNARIGMELFAINMNAGSFANRDKGAKKVVVELDPTDMTKDEIHAYIEDFANGAERAMRCGFDSLIVHGAHGQLPGCFLSKLINGRTDEYSCETIENASRFSRELLQAIREKVGNSMAIEYRINCSDMIPGSPTIEETIAFLKQIEPYIDLVHVSRGMHSMQDLVPYTDPPIYYPHGINLDLAAQIRAGIDTPVTCVGGVTLEQAEEYIAAGKIDMVSMARGLLADPFMIKNAMHGCPEKTRPCVRCNQCINKTHYYLAPIRCSVNAELGMGTLYMNVGPATPKKIAVIGGGAAGLEAARTASKRGHTVTLFEKNDYLGGVLNMAAGPDFKADIKRYLEWSIRTAEEDPNITILKNVEVTPDTIRASDFDAVIVAIGSKPIIPGFTQGNPKIVWVGDVEMGRVEVGKDLVIVGAGLTGCESALALSREGKNVTLVDMIPEENFGRGGAMFNQIAMKNLLKESDVKFRGGMKLVTVEDEAVFEDANTGEKVTFPCDQVVLSLGVRPDAELVESFADVCPEVVWIGDCNTRVGTLYNAVHTAHEAATVL